MFHPGDDYLRPMRMILPPKDNGERLLAKVVEDIEKADGERFQNSATILALAMVKWRKSSPRVNMWTITKLHLTEIRPSQRGECFKAPC